MSYTITGKLAVKNATEQVSDKFKKREFVLNDQDGQYPQEISFQLVQDKVGLLDSYNEGDNIEVSFNLRGRRWQNPNTGETRFFNTLDAWKIGKVVGASTAPSSQQEPQMAAAGSSDEDDLPF